MKKYLLREVKRIQDTPSAVIDFMLIEENWKEVDPDSSLGENSLFSYPEAIYVLSLENASEEVMSFFNNFDNEPKSDFVLKHNIFEGEDEIEELPDEAYEYMHHNCVFAYFYAAIEEEAINTGHFDDDNQVYIFNGLSFNEEQSMEEQAVLALNVTDYDLF
jgi:hypothetical protein